MDAKKRIYETDVMALPPLRMALCEIPARDEEGQRKPDRRTQEAHREMEKMLKRAITYIQDER